MQERENVLRIFRETKDAIERDDSARIKILSDQTINTASLTQDPDNIAVATIVYSLSKILERENYQKMSGWKEFYDIYIKTIGNIIIALEKNDEKKFRSNLNLIRKAVNNLSGNLKENIQDVFRKASINKASKIYEHGISMEKTAKLLGITLWELASYAGEREMPYEKLGSTVDVKSRIKLAMNMFK